MCRTSENAENAVNSFAVHEPLRAASKGQSLENSFDLPVGDEAMRRRIFLITGTDDEKVAFPVRGEVGFHAVARSLEPFMG